MSTASGLRKKKGYVAKTAIAPSRTLGRGVISATTAFSLARGGGSAASARSLGRGGGLAAAATRPTIGGDSNVAPATMDEFPLHPSAFDASCGGSFPSSSTWFHSVGGDPSSPGAWDNDVHPAGGFMSYFGSQPQNFHLDTGRIQSPLNSPVPPSHQVDILDGNDNVRTEKRMLE
ncbi:unnamed protein product [Urochloa humidicola]